MRILDVKLPLIYVLIMVGMLTIPSCISDKKDDVATIQGLWKLDRAFRNDRVTNSLDGLYLNFEGDASFDSNLLGDTSSFSSRIENGKIIVSHDLIKQFTINSLTDSVLKIQTKINEDKISFVFKR